MKSTLRFSFLPVVLACLACATPAYVGKAPVHFGENNQVDGGGRSIVIEARTRLVPLENGRSGKNTGQTGGESASSRGDSIFAEYKRLNNSEHRYNDYRDSDEMLRLKLAQLDYINRSRARYGAQSVRLDILASRVANRMAREACTENFTGHWNTRGEKPYHRYAFAGGLDHVSENASAKWSSAPFSNSPQTYSDFMRESHDRFMSEVAPNDGHKRNCIDKLHNFVGIGVHILDKQFRYYEEYIDRYLDFVDVTRDVGIREKFTVTVRPVREGLHVFAVMAYYEAFPTPMKPAQINRRGSYRDYSGVTAVSLWPWEIDNDPETGNAVILLEFNKPGLYYVQIYLSDKAYTGGGATTRGKIQASGLVVRVE